MHRLYPATDRGIAIRSKGYTF